MTLSERVYRDLLYLYPAAHRREYGQQMVQLFRDLCRHTYRTDRAIGVLGVWLRLLPDLGVSAGAEHLSNLKGSAMRRFCERANLDPMVSISLLVSVALIALGTAARAMVTGMGGSVLVGTAILIAANLAAAAVMEIFARAAGTAIIPTAILVASSLLPLLWVSDAERWLGSIPINAAFIIIAAYWHLSGRGRPSWPVYVVGIVLAAAQIATSFQR